MKSQAEFLTVTLRLLVVAIINTITVSHVLAADPVHVLSINGIATVEHQGTAPRILGSGDNVAIEDLIRTGPDSYAVVRFADGRRMTLRPNTMFRVSARGDSSVKGILTGLKKGGVRVAGGKRQ